ncbi:beta-propeller fold lactonase family protein [Nocardioides sp. Bht2]|uniref:beta-propeller fold lactonase family protein n=1 Tax=Nocardioides sp. Bht2 TaxID=3392297 RepID=UPI0039B585DE
MTQHMRRRTAGLVAALGLVAAGTATVTAAQAEEPTPAAADPLADLGFSVTTKASIAGQYQIAESQDTGDLFVTSAQGRPPITVATLAKIDPVTLEVKQKATLPKLKHGTDGLQHKWLSTHGIYVDDTNDNVWVTNTRDNQVSVFDRESLEYKAGTYDFAGPQTQVAINHPREVVIDEVRNLAYVSAANRGAASEASVTVYSTNVTQGQVIAPIAEIAIPNRENYPVAGESTYAVTMGLDIDEATGRVYTNDFRTDEYYVIDPTSNYALTRHAIPNAGIPTDAVGSLQPSSIAIDPGSNELYTVNQTQGTDKTSLQVFDLTTHALKWSVETGPRALAVDVDRERDLVYVADFANGSVTVVDARQQEIIETIQPAGITKSANHLIVAGGSAYMVDKAGATTGDVDYALNLDTGVAETRSTTIDSITKITPAAEASVTGTAVVGGKVTIKGEGWFSKNGRAGSRIGVKIDDNTFLRSQPLAENPTVWAILQADADGTFTATLQLPDGTTTGANGTTPAFTAGDHTLRLLSGGLLLPAGSDTGRSIQIPLTVGEKPVVTPPAAKPIKNTKKPAITGKAKVGKVLKTTKGTWNTTVTVKYQWLRNGKTIKGATKAKSKATKKDAKKKITVKVTATKSGWKTATATAKAVKIKK